MIQICHLYPEILDIFGDNGNVTAFEKRCLWRDIPFFTERIGLGEEVDFTKYHAIFLGGGTLREQNLIRSELLKNRDSIKDAVEDGVVMLAIDSGFQLLGGYYYDENNEKLSGLGILDCYTQIKGNRLVGYVAVETELTGEQYKMVGFANHSGETFINGAPLGQVLAGVGNNSKDDSEGMRYKNVFCSYLHGPLLPVNTRLTDTLIELAVKKSGHAYEIKPLNDDFEDRARKAMLKRIDV